jgi:Leucine-rich repeat (LRR) protein
MAASTLKLSCKTVDGKKVKYTSWDDLFTNAKNILTLSCNGNRLTTLPKAIGTLTHLQRLGCNDNCLTTLPESIGNLTQLKIIECCNNNLTTLPESIGNLQQLVTIDFTLNKLVYLPRSLGNLPQLRDLCVMMNELVSLPVELVQCRELVNVDYQGNPIIALHAPLRRMIHNRQNAHRRIMDERRYYRNCRGFYDDKQNVHSSVVQATVKRSIYNLLNDTSLEEISIKRLRAIIAELDSDLLLDKTKSALFEYMELGEEHSTLHITFADLLQKVIGRIEKSETEVRRNLYQRLNEEMADAECKCFTGRLSRLVNVLVGYFDDIRIEIAGAEHISALIVLIKGRHNLGDDDEVTPEAKEEIRRELQERGYEAGVIEEWLAALD